MAILVLIAAIIILGLALRYKVRSDAIYQGGTRVGSALFGGFIGPDADEARFVIVRGEPAFQERLPFVHRGGLYEIISSADYDDSSTVLRRFIDVQCQVLNRKIG